MPKHIARLVALVIGFFAVAAFAKWLLTADSFYRFGHFRANSVTEIASQEPAYQTPRYCQSCHAERYAQWSANSHKTVICEVCHGAAQGHPQNGKLPIPADTRKLCTLCHQRLVARPRAQPQIDVAQHAGNNQCIACHNPHSPKLAGAVATIAGNAAEGGKKHAVTCASCHGEKAISPNDTWPNLAGQNAAYLVRILAAFKSGAQKDAMMSPMAETLDDAEIQNLATYYAGLSCGGTATAAPGADVAAGKVLADKNCATCHGATGIPGNAGWPKLAGQKAEYLANTLKAFRGGIRKDPIMSGVVRGLSDTDIANLAGYYAAQSCRPTPLGKTTP